MIRRMLGLGPPGPPESHQSQMPKQMAPIANIRGATSCHFGGESPSYSNHATAIPEIIAFPDKSVSYGQYPKDYQKILQQHLKKQFKDTSKVKVEFVNKPRKIAVETLTGEFYGYRICVSLG